MGSPIYNTSTGSIQRHKGKDKDENRKFNGIMQATNKKYAIFFSSYYYTLFALTYFS